MPRPTLAVITPIWGTRTAYLLDLVANVNSLHRAGIQFEWSVTADGDKRHLEQTIRRKLLPEMRRFCTVATLDENCGQSKARNIAVRATDCEHVCWLDADDSFDVSNFARIVSGSLLEKALDRYDLVFTDSYDCDSRLKTMALRRKGFIHDLHTRFKATADDPLLCVDYVYQPQFLKKSTFLSAGEFDESLRLGEDVEFILKVAGLSREVNFLHVPTPTYLYRDNPNGICRSKWPGLRRQMESIYLQGLKRWRMRPTGVSYAGSYEIRNRRLQPSSGISRRPLFDVYLQVRRYGALHKPPYVCGQSPFFSG